MRCWQKAKRVEAEEQKGEDADVASSHPATVASSHAASDSARPLVVTRCPQEEGVGRKDATQDGILRQVYHKATDTNVSFSSPSAPRRYCLAMLVVVFGCVGCAKVCARLKLVCSRRGWALVCLSLLARVFISTCFCAVYCSVRLCAESCA
jgi:hypothetical protein